MNRPPLFAPIITWNRNALKAARQDAGLSLRTLAARVGVSATAISQWERGLRSPNAFVIARLCSALQIQPADLFDTAA